jgi:para-nitrobenzyl esterase
MHRAWLLTLAITACGSEANDLEVRIDTGTIRGVHQGDARAFLGIPYAAPPVGDNRWKPPQPALPIDGILDTVQVGLQCPQTFSLAGPGGEEDCLFVNVWTPPAARAQEKGPLPVMVWLHGGAFIFGSGGDSYYNGEHLASTFDVIVVTVNYRLGMLGFFAHPAFASEDPAYPTAGNYGLDDQFAALQWVHRNIRAFGGDPDRVLLDGESAGGYSTCVHYLSPRTEGLFAWAISESGLCASNILEPTKATVEAAAQATAQQLGCTATDPVALRACLRGKTTQQLLDATKIPAPADQPPGGPFYAGLETLSMFPYADGFVLPKPMRELFAGGNFAKRPLIVGTNKDEGTMFHTSFFATEVANETEYRAALGRHFSAANVDAIVARYSVAMYGTANKALAAVSGDAFFTCPARRVARGVVAAGAPVFRYRFEQALDAPFAPDLGVFHASELPFVFGNDTFPLGKIGAGGPVADELQGYWTRFAATGDPNGDGATPWPAFDATGEQHLVFANPTTIDAHLAAASCDFWDTLP